MSKSKRYPILTVSKIPEHKKTWDGLAQAMENQSQLIASH